MTRGTLGVTIMSIYAKTMYLTVITVLFFGCGKEAEKRDTSAGQNPTADGSGGDDTELGGDDAGNNEDTVPELVASGESDMEGWEVDVLSRHNTYRKDVKIENFQWNKVLAETAQAWADSLKKDGCATGHSDTKYGENISAYTTSLIITEQHIDRWGDERSDYTYESNTCAEKKECGHYTQLVWKDTKTVGCGRSTCEAAPNYDIVVCNYYPIENVKGQKPY